MQLRCGDILNSRFVANCIENVLIKEFGKLVNNSQRCGQYKV